MFNGSLHGRFILTAGLGGMGGAQPLAATMNGAVCLCVEVDRHRIERRLQTRYLDRLCTELDEAVDLMQEAKAQQRPLSIGLLGNAADVLPGLSARHSSRCGVDQTSAIFLTVMCAALCERLSGSDRAI